MNFKMKAKPTPKIKMPQFVEMFGIIILTSFFPVNSKNITQSLNSLKSSSQIYIWQILIDYSKHTLQEGVRE